MKLNLISLASCPQAPAAAVSAVTPLLNALASGAVLWKSSAALTGDRPANMYSDSFAMTFL